MWPIWPAVLGSIKQCEWWCKMTQEERRDTVLCLYWPVAGDTETCEWLQSWTRGPRCDSVLLMWRGVLEEIEPCNRHCRSNEVVRFHTAIEGQRAVLSYRMSLWGSVGTYWRGERWYFNPGETGLYLVLTVFVVKDLKGGAGGQWYCFEEVSGLSLICSSVWGMTGTS